MKPRMQRPFTATPGRQRGAVMVLIVIALASMLLMGALALDGGHMLLNKTRLQNAVDAAALSGAKTLQQVTGSGNSSSVTRDAALNTLRLNADADGNGELSDGIGGDGVGAFAVVELSNSVYGPFSYPGPADAAYVRVSVPDYPLVGFLWNVVNMFGSGDLEKAVAAIATAGPSPSANPCRIEPILVCGDPTQYDPANGNFWGYGFGDLEVLKSAAGNEPAIGPGNFQLLRLDGATGANDLRDALAGGIDKCNVVGEEAETEPGNTVGPVAQGLNTRLGVYSGNMSAADYPRTGSPISPVRGRPTTTPPRTWSMRARWSIPAMAICPRAAPICSTTTTGRRPVPPAPLPEPARVLMSGACSRSSSVIATVCPVARPRCRCWASAASICCRRSSSKAARPRYSASSSASARAMALPGRYRPTMSGRPSFSCTRPISAAWRHQAPTPRR